MAAFLCIFAVMITIAVDPGKKGGYSVAKDGEIISVGNLGDNPSKTISSVAKRYPGAHWYIESVHAMPGQGVVSMFTFGKGFGEIIGALNALDIPFYLISPQQWTGKIKLPNKLINKPDKKMRKEFYLSVAKKLWPSATLYTADAILINHCINFTNLGVNNESIQNSERFVNSSVNISRQDGTKVQRKSRKRK